jgi:ankyrin repeat protein
MRSPLHKAAFNDNIDIIKLLLKSGADPRLTDDKFSIPAYYCQSQACKAYFALWNIEDTEKIRTENETRQRDLLMKNAGDMTQIELKKRKRLEICDLVLHGKL